jgi:hypothetical protein
MKIIEEEDWVLPQPKACVIVDGDFVPVDAVEFLNIEEDITGRDLMTFIYKGKTLQSFIVIR